MRDKWSSFAYFTFFSSYCIQAGHYCTGSDISARLRSHASPV